jgi:predicted nucleic acid-binding protein
MASVIRVVLDTNVVFEGLSDARGACAQLMDAWLARDIFVPCLSLSVALEYQHALSKFGRDKRKDALAVLSVLVALAESVECLVKYRPLSRDAGDDHVIECVMNAGAALCTRNTKDFEAAALDLGFDLYDPEQLASKLRLHLEEPWDE